MKQKIYTTDFLFSTPSFSIGAGTVMNLAGNYYEFNGCDSELEADNMAIQSDFDMIGQDLKSAMESIKSDKHKLMSAK